MSTLKSVGLFNFITYNYSNGYVVVAELKTEFDMKQLIEDYERRLQTAETMLKEKDYSSAAQAERIKTKASCYRTFIAELKKQCNIANVVVPKGTLCECGGSERVALDCTMKPCKHPKDFSK